jgi:hypothetical protein
MFGTKRLAYCFCWWSHGGRLFRGVHLVCILVKNKKRDMKLVPCPFREADLFFFAMIFLINSGSPRSSAGFAPKTILFF